MPSKSSAAFNLNKPIEDDLEPNTDGTPKILVRQVDIGRRGIELAVLGGFDKVTWDGAADTYPSHCESCHWPCPGSLSIMARRYHPPTQVSERPRARAPRSFSRLDDVLVCWFQVSKHPRCRPVWR